MMETTRRFNYTGQRYQVEVPDTLDLVERAALAINGVGGIMDPEMGYLPFWSVHYTSRTPHMLHCGSSSIACDPKTGQSIPMMRIMSGSSQHMEAELANRVSMISRVQDGLYWDYYDPARPWRASESRQGKVKNEDVCVVMAAGLMARAVLTWRELSEDPKLDQMAGDLIAGMRRVAILKDDYAYYPEKGGWGEPCTYPRSGWLNTDEPQSATDGAEGDIGCYQSNQIYAAAQWYAVTGSPEALDLAARLARFCMKPKFWGGVPDPDREHAKARHLPGHVAAGLADPACTAGAELGHWYSHFHARAITLRALLEFGRVAGDERALEFVRRAYEFTLTQGIARMGWINCYPVATNFCEGCALGDQVAMGIRLSDAGLGDYWDNVDAVVRNHLVEGQLTRADLLEKVAAASEEDDCRTRLLPQQGCWDNVIARSLGVFAGASGPNSIPTPWVMHCCTGNGTRGLYYAWEGTVREKGDTAQVNLLLNRASKLLDVDSYLPYEGKVVLRNKAARRISVRIPYWVARHELRAEVSGQNAPLDWIGSYLVLGGLKPADTITLKFPIKETTAKYTVNANTDQEQVYTCTFRGSTLVDILPHDTTPTSYPLYQRDHLRLDKAPMKTIERFVADRTVLNW